MKSCVRNIIRNAIKEENEIRNILITPYDGIFELLLATHTPHNYYILQENVSLPVKHERIHYLPFNMQKWPYYLDIDLIICNDITTQLQASLQLSQVLQVPMIIVNHDIRAKHIKNEDIYILNSQQKNTTRISTSEIINKSWYANFPIISPTIPEIPIHTKKNAATIINNFNNDTILMIRQIAQQLTIPLQIIGNNPGVSKSEDIPTCINAITSNNIYINFSENITHYLLIAMASGCKIISVSSPSINSLIQDGINGYIVNHFGQILQKIKQADIPTLSKNAFVSIKNNYSSKIFSQKWNSLISEVSHIGYTL